MEIERDSLVSRVVEAFLVERTRSINHVKIPVGGTTPLIGDTGQGRRDGWVFHKCSL